MSETNERSVASTGSGLHRVEFTLHWSADTEKGRQRICARVTLNVPFVPMVGQCIQLADDLPSPKIKEVVWRHFDETFSAQCRMRLKDWDSKLFESLVGDIRGAGLGMEPKLFDDNWMDQIKGQ